MIERKHIKPSTALVKLQELCARSEQCSSEIITRLDRWNIPHDTKLKILALLKRDRYVDDNRYARAFVRDKVVFNRWGRVKIKISLITKKIAPDIISDALGSIDHEEYLTALRDTLTAKGRSLTETDSYESRNKLLRHAASRGFEISLASAMLKELFPKGMSEKNDNPTHT